MQLSPGSSNFRTQEIVGVQKVNFTQKFSKTGYFSSKYCCINGRKFFYKLHLGNCLLCFAFTLCLDATNLYLSPTRGYWSTPSTLILFTQSFIFRSI